MKLIHLLCTHTHNLYTIANRPLYFNRKNYSCNICHYIKNEHQSIVYVGGGGGGGKKTNNKSMEKCFHVEANCVDKSHT